MWMLLVAAVLTLGVPLVVALFEGLVRCRRSALRSGHVSCWRLARELGGVVRQRWDLGTMPVVEQRTSTGVVRVRVDRKWSWRAWQVETRCYQNLPFGFAARVCSPRSRCASWRHNALPAYEPHPDDDDWLEKCGLQTNQPELLRWVLQQGEIRDTLDELRVSIGARAMRIELAGRAIVARADVRRTVSADEAIEVVGAGLAEAVAQLSGVLDMLSTALENAGEALADEDACPACGLDLDGRQWHCAQCGMRLHVACVLATGGCLSKDCPGAADSPAGQPIRSTRVGRSAPAAPGAVGSRRLSAQGSQIGTWET